MKEREMRKELVLEEWYAWIEINERVKPRVNTDTISKELNETDDTKLLEGYFYWSISRQLEQKEFANN